MNESMDCRLRITDYLDASGDASRRARIVLATLVIASILTGMGVLNSLQFSWMRHRLIESSCDSLLSCKPDAAANGLGPVAEPD